MQRSFNAVIDNGLFVLAYYLKKNVEDIEEKDIEESITFMSNKVVEYFRNDKYSKLTSMLFMNSVLTQKTKETLAERLNSFMDECRGDEMCYICGKYNCNSKNSLGRSYLLNSCAGTFYNFSNNLQGMNVCPYCVALTMYASLNFTKCGNVAVYYNSTSDDFMTDYTWEKQRENKIDILNQAKFDKKNDKNAIHILEELLNKHKIYDGYIEQYKISNGGTDQIVEVNTINSANLKTLNSIIKSGYYEEFKSFNFMYYLLKGNLSNVYINKIYDWEKYELKCSRKFFEYMNKEVNRLNDDIVKVVKNIIDKVNDKNMDIKKLVNRLKGINSFGDFENILVELCDTYESSYGEKLFTVDEYLLLDNIRKYKNIKNLMIVGLIVK